MKKLLIATTALVATAGVAAAEVTISGNGRMGVVYDGDTLQFSSRVRADVNLSGTTDGGLEFGGSFGIHNAGNRTNNADGAGGLIPDFDGAGGANVGNSGSIYVSGAFGKLEMGDVVGAAEAVVGDLPEIGFTDIANNDTTFITGDGALVSPNNPVALYTYTTGGLTFAVSFNDGSRQIIEYTPDDIGTPAFDPVFTEVEDKAQEYALGVKYAFGDYAVGLGFEGVDPGPGDGESYSHVVVGFDATFGTTTAKLIYGQGSGNFVDDFTQWGLGVTSTFDAITVKAMIKNEDFGGGDDETYYGIGAEYDLGGGAKVAGGISDVDSPNSDMVADLGLKFSF